METLTTTDISKRLGFALRADYIRSLGIEPLLVTKTSVLWDAGIVNTIRERLVERLKNGMEGDVK
jgi:hypothetical protein